MTGAGDMLTLVCLAALADAGAGPGMVDVSGEVLDVRLCPTAGVGVFAIEQGGGRVRGWARSGADGKFRMRLPAAPHDFGILSPHWLFGEFQATGPTSVRIRVHAAFPGNNADQMLAAVKGFAPALVRPRGQIGPPVFKGRHAIGNLAGRVIDDNGTPLGGVLVVAIDGRNGQPLNVTLTDPKGRWELATVAGPNRVAALVPGLKLGRARRPKPDQLELVMTIDAAVDHVTIRTGRVLRFNLNDSVYPAMVPPPQVRAVLKMDYHIDMDVCFCPGDLRKENNPARVEQHRVDRCVIPAWISCKNASECPPTVWERQCKLPKYWWLKLLHVTPPPAVKPWERWWEDLFRKWQIEEFGE